MRLLILLLLISVTFGEEICLKMAKSADEDSYVAHRVYHKLKNLFLEAGFKLACTENAKRIYIAVSYSETPISLSSRQRVSSYILYLRVHLNDRKFTGSIPYSVNASYGEIPRRRAIEEAFDRIKLNILEYLLELKKHAGDRGDKKSNS